MKSQLIRIWSNNNYKNKIFKYIQIIILYYLENINKKILNNLKNYSYIALITRVIYIYKKLSLIYYIIIINRQAVDK